MRMTKSLTQKEHYKMCEKHILEELKTRLFTKMIPNPSNRDAFFLRHIKKDWILTCILECKRVKISVKVGI